jgi:hypothetical protein
LIDRRYRWPRRVPCLAIEHCNSLTARRGQGQLASVDKESHINVRGHQRTPHLRASGAPRGYATFCILLAKSRPDVGGGSGLPSL